jgi:riboflavin kinase/FMN adenylyltransferase
VIKNGPITIEVHIFEFNHEIYHKDLTIYFHKRLREEEKYDTLEALTAQLALDKVNALNFLN